jgi:hypothetical protein
MPQEMFASDQKPDGSIDVTIPPHEMQGMSPMAMIGLVTALVKAAPAIMALWPEVMALWPEITAIVDQIKQQLPKQPTSVGTPPS